MIKLILLLVVSYISLSDACSCAFIIGWQKQAYCIADFGGTFKVLSDGYLCPDDENSLCYDIEVVQQYKGNPVSVTVFRTATQSAACGVTLAEGHIYFVASGTDGISIGAGLCSLIEDWTYLTCCEMIEKAIAYRCDGVGPNLEEPEIESA